MSCAEAVVIPTGASPASALVAIPELAQAAAEHGAPITHGEAANLAHATGDERVPATTVEANNAVKRACPDAWIESARALSQPETQKNPRARLQRSLGTEDLGD